MFFRAADKSSPAGRNSGEVEVIEFPPLSCHLLATCARLREAAWAGKEAKGALACSSLPRSEANNCRPVVR